MFKIQPLKCCFVIASSDPFSKILLPMEAPPALQDLPENILDEIQPGL